MAWRLQHVESMSVKTLLPIFGLGSAFVIIGLVTARRKSNERVAHGAAREPRLASRVHPRVPLEAEATDHERNDDEESNATLTRVPLTHEFWDTAPDSDSYSLAEQPSRPGGSFEAYDTVDTEDLTAEWLTRATEAPAVADGSVDADDPAEIPADSVSMVSDASRHAAAFEPDDVEPPSQIQLPRS